MVERDGKMFHSMAVNKNGDIIHTVKIKPASNVMFVYFLGVKEPERPHTVPLFFTVILGDNPYVLEKTPRYAGTQFDEALRQ